MRYALAFLANKTNDTPRERSLHRKEDNNNKINRNQYTLG